MKVRGLTVALSSALVAVGLAGPALGQEATTPGDETAFLRAEVNMLKALFNKQREQIEALQKQIGELTGEVKRLQDLYEKASQAREATPPAPGTLEPVPRDRPGFLPSTGPSRDRTKPQEKPKTDFAEIQSLLNAVPVSLVAPAARANAAEQARQAQDVSRRLAGKTLFAEVLVTSVRLGPRGARDVTGTAQASRQGRSVKCTLYASFSSEDSGDPKELRPGRKIALVGSLSDLKPAPAGGALGIYLSGCRLAGAGAESGVARAEQETTTGKPPAEAEAKFASVKALTDAIPREYLAGQGGSAEEVKKTKEQLDAWVQGQLVGSVLRGEGTMLRTRTLRGSAIVQFFNGPPQFESDHPCYIDVSFAPGEGEKLQKAAMGYRVEFLGKISSASIFARGPSARIQLQLTEARVISFGLAKSRGPVEEPRYIRGPRRP